jgi:phosphoribosylformylglycinamidine synthase
MCYEVTPDDVAAVRAVAERYDLGCSVVGEVTDGDYVCRFDGETVVDVPADFLTDGAPAADLERAPAPEAPPRDLPDVSLREAVAGVVADPTVASREWVYRQYDHEVGLRTAVPPGGDAALLDVHEAGCGLALTAGSTPRWTTADAYDGARAVALAAATNLAATGARPLAAVDCLNGGNPETPAVYGAFARVVDGLADACRDLSVPVVGGNVSLYNDSASGPIPPTPTLAMVGTTPDLDAPARTATGEGDLYLVGTGDGALGGSAYLAVHGGTDAFPSPSDPSAVDAARRVARLDSTRACRSVAGGGLAVALAALVGPDVGATAVVGDRGALFGEAPGRVVVESTDGDAVRDAAGDVPVRQVGEATAEGRLSLSVDGRTATFEYGEVAESRAVLARGMD